MPFLSKVELSNIRESMLNPAHYVTNNPTLRLSDNESLRRAVEGIQEKVGRIVLWQARAVNVNNSINVGRSEYAK